MVLPNFDRLTRAVWTPSRLVTSRKWIRGMVELQQVGSVRSRCCQPRYGPSTVIAGSGAAAVPSGVGGLLAHAHRAQGLAGGRRGRRWRSGRLLGRQGLGPVGEQPRGTAGRQGGELGLGLAEHLDDLVADELLPVDQGVPER